MCKARVAVLSGNPCALLKEVEEDHEHKNRLHRKSHQTTMPLVTVGEVHVNTEYEPPKLQTIIPLAQAS